jgi:prophage antirepressor-like protein
LTDTNIRPFLFEGEHTIRVIPQPDGKMWVVGKDVASALGYKNTVSAIATHCKHAKAIGEGERESRSPYGIDPQTKIIPEGDAYRLVLKSELPSAERFELWLMDEVLPALRQTGTYSLPAPIEEEDIQTPDGLKLRKVNTATRCFGERAGAQLWAKLGLDWVPAMAAVLSQGDLLDSPHPPGSVTITVTPNNQMGGAH